MDGHDCFGTQIISRIRKEEDIEEFNVGNCQKVRLK